MNITDKFGKASISTNYAVATTVKTARLSGVTVLEAFDLSKFAPDTPVYFVTYKKTTDPVTGVVSVTNQVSYKALVNPDNNTLTNMTLAPGYTDVGNAVGDFIECMPTSFWGNSLVEGISVSLNPDGSLKTSAVNTALGITGTTPPDWNVLPVIPTVISNNGQKEHVIRYTGVDYTPTIGVGAKLRIPRTGVTPTTSMNFVAASSQYAQKASPTGLIYTTTYSMETMVNLTSYPAANMGLIGRYDGTNGAVLHVVATTGQLALNAGGATFQTSYQSIPLNKDVHVAGTFASGTFVLYIDGVAVPSYKTGSATSITQAGNLQLGAYNSTAFLDGRLSNARIWSTTRTAAEIRDNANKETPTSTTGLVAHFKGNSSWNDTSTNANHLTAVGGAVNNFAAHPYSAVEYAISTKVQYTGGNTDVTIFTGNGCLPQETLGATSYSGLGRPFGFPASRTKWVVKSTFKTQQSLGSGTSGVWYHGGGVRLTIPSGEWDVAYKAPGQITSGSTNYVGVNMTFSNTNSTELNADFTTVGAVIGAANTEVTSTHVINDTPLIVPTLAEYFLNAKVGITGNIAYFNGAGGAIVITAKCPYL